LSGGAVSSRAADEVYSRQIPLLGVEGQERLSKSRVAVVGLGGLGSSISTYLAAAGVSLRLVDWDLVEPSNLNRQVLYTRADVGRPKAFAAAERLRALNPDVDLEPFYRPVVGRLAREVVRGVDLVLDAADNAAVREAVNETCVAEGVPHTYAAVDGWFGAYAFFMRPGEDPCLACLFPQGLRDHPVHVVGPVPALVGAVSAADAIKFLSGAGQPTRGKMLIFDLREMTFESVEISRNPECRVCGRVEYREIDEDPGRVFSRGGSHFFFEPHVRPLAALRRARELGWRPLEVRPEFSRFDFGGVSVVAYSEGGVLVKGAPPGEAERLVGDLLGVQH